MSDNTHAAMCIYCGEKVIYDTRKVNDMAAAHAQLVEHDQQCSKNPLVEDLARHKRMFVAACETLGEIQQALGNSIVGCEPALVKELVEERDALKLHAERVAAAVGYDDNSAYQLDAGVQAHCINNVKRFAEHLHAIEREFFMVPGEPDEDYPDAEPDDECLMNCWGSTTEQYVEQFRAALERRDALKQAEILEQHAESLGDCTRNYADKLALDLRRQAEAQQ